MKVLSQKLLDYETSRGNVSRERYIHDFISVLFRKPASDLVVSSDSENIPQKLVENSVIRLQNKNIFATTLYLKLVSNPEFVVSDELLEKAILSARTANSSGYFEKSFLLGLLKLGQTSLIIRAEQTYGTVSKFFTSRKKGAAEFFLDIVTLYGDTELQDFARNRIIPSRPRITI